MKACPDIFLVALPVMTANDCTVYFTVNIRNKRSVRVPDQKSFHSIAAVVNMVKPHSLSLP